MLDPKLFDELASKLAANLPPGVKELQSDVEGHFRSTLQTTLSKLHLITREEFEVQSDVLTRTRAKLEALEKRVAELEQRLTPQ